MTNQSAVAKRVAVVFPGQGSQTVGMMNELAEKYQEIRATFDVASQALGFDLWEVTQDESRLHQTQYTQPALLTASVAIWRVLSGILAEKNMSPVYLAGHSLGEYSALVASGVLSLEDAVRLVHERGKLMTAAVADIETQMAAVLGVDDDVVADLCQQAKAQTNASVNPANFNSPGQVVIAGDKTGVSAVVAVVGELGKKAMPLKVSVPSHCELMKPASDALADLLAKTQFLPAQIEVVQNRHAAVHQATDEIKTALTEQLSMPVQWAKTMNVLADAEVELVIECGPGNVLTNLAKRQATPIAAMPTDSIARLESLENLA